MLLIARLGVDDVSGHMWVYVVVITSINREVGVRLYHVWPLASMI